MILCSYKRKISCHLGLGKVISFRPLAWDFLAIISFACIVTIFFLSCVFISFALLQTKKFHNPHRPIFGQL